MEQQLPMALQSFLYLGSIAIIVLATVLVVFLLQLRNQVERAVRAVEELKAEVNPLARETRVMVEGLRDLSGRVQGQWAEVEKMVEMARSWSERANHLVEEVGSMVEPPLLAASRNIRILRSGLATFVSVLLGRDEDDKREDDAHEKARAS